MARAGAAMLGCQDGFRPPRARRHRCPPPAVTPPARRSPARRSPLAAPPPQRRGHGGDHVRPRLQGRPQVLLREPLRHWVQAKLVGAWARWGWAGGRQGAGGAWHGLRGGRHHPFGTSCEAAGTVRGAPAASTQPVLHLPPPNPLCAQTCRWRTKPDCMRLPAKRTRRVMPSPCQYKCIKHAFK